MENHWNKFAESGKIEDYLKYREIVNATEHIRVDNTRADGGRERPSGNGIDC